MIRSSEPWPNLFIVGAPKAGTTAFYSYLARHRGAGSRVA